jgi:predicted ribosome-associated RNA-binding protein Tma20
MALLQKEEIENKKIRELGHALKDNKEIKSRSNAARVHWKAEVIILLLVDSSGFMVWTKHNHIITVIETWRIMNVE